MGAIRLDDELYAGGGVPCPNTEAITTINSNVATVKSDVATIKSDASTIKTDVAIIKSDAATIKSDVTTMKNAQYFSETGINGRRYNGTAEQVYNTTTSQWENLPTGGGGGASPTLVVINKDMTMTGVTVTVTSADGLATLSKEMPDANYVVFELPWLSNYNVSWPLPSGQTHTQPAVVNTVGGITSDAAIPKLTVINGSNQHFTGEQFTVTSNDGTITYTVTMPDAASVDVPLDSTGTWTVTWRHYPFLDDSASVAVSTNTGTSFTLTYESAYPTFSNASWSMIKAMADLHYAGTIDLTTIWSKNDTKTIDLAAMAATGVGESHAAQTVTMRIDDFNHCKLVTPINGHTTAVLLLGQVDSLNETGYMNSSNTNVGGWRDSARRSWCNNVYFAALPSDCQAAIKTVERKNGQGNSTTSGSYTTSDKVFLYAAPEIFGSDSYAVPDETSYYSQVNAYKTSSNRIKRVSGSAYAWWESSPHSGNSARFCYVSSSGSADRGNAGAAYGLAPAYAI